MLETKAFEVRDRATFVPILAIRLPSGNDQEQWLQHKVGYRGFYLGITKLSGVIDFKWFPDEWIDKCTMPIAHRYIREHWDELQGGEVIDCEFLRGKRNAPRVSEREETL